MGQRSGKELGKMVKCEKCKKEIRWDKIQWIKENGVGMNLCQECRGEETEEETRDEAEKEKNEKIKSVKDFVDNSGLSIPELQLYELNKIKSDLKTVKDIMIFLLIMFIISLLVSIGTYLYFTGSL